MENYRQRRLRAQRGRKVGSMCPICDQLVFLPRLVCSHSATLSVRIDGSGLSMLLKSIGVPDIESHTRCQSTVRRTS